MLGIRRFVATQGVWQSTRHAGVGQRQPLGRWLSSIPVTKDKEEEEKSSLAQRLKTRRKLPDPITLTDSAVDRLKFLLEKKPSAKAVVLGVKRRGCNGLSYTLKYADEIPKFADKVTKDGITVIIEPKASMHLIGTRMDYYEDALSAEFKFENPNAKGSCGCGESFNVN